MWERVISFCEECDLARPDHVRLTIGACLADPCPVLHGEPSNVEGDPMTFTPAETKGQRSVLPIPTCHAPWVLVRSGSPTPTLPSCETVAPTASLPLDSR